MSPADLTDRQRKLLFAGLVVVLALIGVYLTLPGASDGERAEPRETPGSVRPSAPPTATAPGIDTTVNPEAFDIYRLLPFSRAEFADAAGMAQRFIAAHGTYRFDEEPQDYAGRLTPLVNAQLRTELERSSATPGVLEERRSKQTVAVGSASIDGIRDIEENSVIFVVTGHQVITESGEESNDSERYAVTVSREGGSWRVYAFTPADVGQAGDTG